MIIDDKHNDGLVLIYSDQLSEIKRLIDEGIDLNERYEDGDMPIHWAARLGTFVVALFIPIGDHFIELVHFLINVFLNYFQINSRTH